MEQYKALKQLYHLPKIASIRISQLQRTFDNADILMMLILLFSLLNFCGILYSVTVLLFGFIMPCYCRSQDIYVSQYYFEVLAFLLWLRLWDNRFTTLDAFIIVSLWHPNFRIAEKAVRWLKQKVAPKATLLDKINKKVDKILD